MNISENVEVKDLWKISNGNYQLDTDEGIIECETLVLACGLWSRHLAAKLGARVPLFAAEHFYV